MGIIIDLVIILLIALSVFLGYKKGLILLGIQLISFIVAIIITLVLYRPIGNIIINSTTIDENLQKVIENNIGKFLAENNENKAHIAVVEDAKNGMLLQTSKTLSINIIYWGTMILLFLISKICLLLIKSLADLVTKLPILKQFNELGGALYGLLRGLLVTYVVLMIINILISVNPKSQLNEIMDETYVAKTMSTYNILNIFLNKTEI